MTDREQARIQVLNGVLEGNATVSKAAGLMEVSERHTWGVLAAYGGEGAAAVAHGNRGRKPGRHHVPGDARAGEGVDGRAHDVRCC